ncbi:MAG: 2OG-Fe(II) oxygenase [Proteobacteria bacterium]|nr:2OG-Fe(II) oxygenase [Pseudomonadota bacterium]
MNFEYLGDPKMGIVVFKNSISSSDTLVNELEQALTNSHDETYSWKDALVGEGTKMPDYRDCVDFKVNKKTIDSCPEEFYLAKKVYNIVADALLSNVKLYQQKYNMNMNYMEAINFVRYGEGQHFAVHTDHGFSYICTVSSVVYLNDDYEGGELWFPYLDLKWKPSKGDMVFFPSTYIYAHASLPVTNGIKYSAVTMFDYNDDAHGYSGFSRKMPGTSYDSPASAPVSLEQENNTILNQNISDNDNLRAIIREEIQAYAMESWKQWQENGGANQEYSQYVAGAR